MGFSSSHWRWLTRRRLGVVGSLVGVAWSCFSAVLHPGGVGLTAALIVVGVAALVVSGAILVWDSPWAVSVRVRAASPYAIPPPPRPVALVQTLSVAWESGVFHAIAAVTFARARFCSWSV